ncbi:hypothetical protein J4427_03250 [Candidatus Woesearchaeota archaeon]|nr:hypothetical protein [Candidatus Woesearchaeota archaeon]
MKEKISTLVEFLDNNKSLGPLVVDGIYPLNEVTITLKNGTPVYSLYISNPEINKLPQIYKDRIIFKPLNLKLVKEAKIENEENALKYIDDFIRERMNKRVKR